MELLMSYSKKSYWKHGFYVWWMMNASHCNLMKLQLHIKAVQSVLVCETWKLRRSAWAKLLQMQRKPYFIPTKQLQFLCRKTDLTAATICALGLLWAHCVCPQHYAVFHTKSKVTFSHHLTYYLSLSLCMYFPQHMPVPTPRALATYPSCVLEPATSTICH